MTKFLVGISTICLLLLTACGVAVMLETLALIKDIRSDVAAIDRETVETLTLVKQAAGNANTASSQLAGAAEEQRVYWNKTGLETYKTAAAARLLIVRTDKSLNDKLIPQIQMEIEGTRVDLHEAIVDSNRLMARATDLVTHADGILTDPNLRQMIANLAEATHDLDISIKQLNSMLVSTTATAEDVRKVADKVAEQYTKARNLYYALLKELLNMGGSAAQMIK